MLTITEKKLADSRKRAKILADNRKCHHPIETLIKRCLKYFSIIIASTIQYRDSQSIIQAFKEAIVYKFVVLVALRQNPLGN